MASTKIDPDIDILADSSDDEAILFEDVDDEESHAVSTPPVHPIRSMQGPFEESIKESLDQTQADDSQRSSHSLGAKARRQRLLDGAHYNDSYNAKWKKNSKAKFHPLTKIIAQISFGVHLLNQQLAKSDEEVVRILQRHVDEVDGFVQRTDEDLDLAIADISERINYLKLPLEHVNIFDIMLEDRQFRASIIDGNEKIEKIVNRTANLMNDLLVDVNKGAQASKEMSLYLKRIKSKWPTKMSTVIYNTMMANAEGWIDCFQTLQMKGNSLGVALVQLGSILNEMSKRAGVASRRNLATASQPGSASEHRPPSKSQTPGNKSSSRRPRTSGKSSPLKPLPKDPDTVVSAVQATLPKDRNGTVPLPKSVEKRHQRSDMSSRGTTSTVQSANSSSTETTKFMSETDKNASKTRTSSSKTAEPASPTASSQGRLRLRRRRSKSQKKSQELPSSSEATPADGTQSPVKRKPVPINTREAAGGRDRSPTAQDSAYSSGSSHVHPESITALPKPEKLNDKLGELFSRPGTSRSVNPPSQRRLNLFPSTGASLASTRGQSEVSVLLKDQVYPDPYSPPRLHAKPKVRKASGMGVFGKIFGKWGNKSTIDVSQ